MVVCISIIGNFADKKSQYCWKFSKIVLNLRTFFTGRMYEKNGIFLLYF